MKTKHTSSGAITFRLLAAVAILLVIRSVAVAQFTDTLPPQLLRFEFSPVTIDVRSGPQQVMVTIGASDDLSGVEFSASNFGTTVVLRSPTNNQRIILTTPFFSLASGNSLNGIWVGTVTVPQFSQSGVWKVESVSVRDMVRNVATFTTDVLVSKGFPTDLTVQSTPDVTPPQLTSLSIEPPSIDVSTGNQSVDVIFGLTDEQSGLDFLCNAFCFTTVGIQSPSRSQTQTGAIYNVVPVSGTPQNGIWKITITLPRYSENGTWNITFLSFRDAAGNTRTLSTAALQAQGFPTSVNVASVPSDTSPPQMTGFDFTRVIDTSDGPQTVDVTTSLTDNLSGLDFFAGFASPNFNIAFISFLSQSGAQRHTLTPYISPITLITGTPLDGTWKWSLTFPRFSEFGLWRVEFLRVQDDAGNFVLFDTARLKMLGFPTELTVVSRSLDADGEIEPTNGGTVSDNVFGPRAQVTVPGGVLNSRTEVTIDVFQQPLPISNPAGFSAGPATRFVNIDLVPEPVFPLPFPGLTVVLPLVNPMIPGSSLVLFRVDEATFTLVPAIGVNGMPVVGTVNVDGLSATFMGISRLSIVVGLIPDKTTADLAVVSTVSRDPVAVGATMDYRVLVFNNGPSAALGSTLENRLPQKVVAINTNASQGTCAYSSNTHSVNCDLGAIQPYGYATVVIKVRVLAPGLLFNTSSVKVNSSLTIDPASYNDTFTKRTTAR